MTAKKSAPTAAVKPATPAKAATEKSGDKRVAAVKQPAASKTEAKTASKAVAADDKAKKGRKPAKVDEKAKKAELVEEDGDENGQDHADHGDGFVLAGQIGRGAGLDGCCDFLHPGVARVLRKNPAADPHAVDDGNQTASDGQHDRVTS